MRQMDYSDPGFLLAFCHIEKAAGTSLTHILRRIFFLRYAAVRPLQSGTGHYFTYRDLVTFKKCNPFLRAIGGHSVVPHTDLVSFSPQIKFITQVRDPVARAVSQYRFWVNRMNEKPDTDAFLAHHASSNFQVRKIAGVDDLELAKEMIRRYFLLAGSVRQFDEFLVLLAGKLRMPIEWFTYERKNIAREDGHAVLPGDFSAKLRERNQLDQALFDWIETEYFPDLVANYEGDFAANLRKFRTLQARHARPRLALCIDSMYRNAYIKPLTGLIRLAHGLPYSGSYALTDVR